MKERPILFSDPMVRALLSGQKTQTRRVVKPLQVPKRQDDGTWFSVVQNHRRWGFGVSGDTEQECAAKLVEFGGCPYGQPGDRLWVRECFADPCYRTTDKDSETVIYRSGHEEAAGSGPRVDVRWKPSIHMPRWACRLVLEIVSVRVERLQDITVEDAIAEGVHPAFGLRSDDDLMVNTIGLHLAEKASLFAVPAPLPRFVLLWDSINGVYPKNWNANPFVWRIEFRRLQP